MKKILKVLFFLTAALLVVITGLMAIAYRPYFLPENMARFGEGYDVEILRDTYGVPHIFGKTDLDTAFGLAWAHSEDDFEIIQGSLAAARGELASIYGESAAPNDYMVHLLRSRDVVDAGYPSLPEDIRNLCQAYADGLNYYASTHPEEALASLYPVTGADVVAGFVHKVPLFVGIEGVLKQLFSPEPMSELVSSVNEEASKGSNTFAVGPGRTADGSTFLAVNSHQPWSGPVAWYEAHLHSEEGWDMVGGLFPGSPLILHGHNRDLGWAYTVNHPDLVDVYELTLHPDNPDYYKLDGSWRKFEIRIASMEVKILGPIRWTFDREVLWSEFGPAVRRNDGTFAVRFSGYGETGHIEQWFRMNKANTFDEWYKAQERMAIPMFNAGYADREGNTFYLYNARLPVRDSRFAWDGVVRGDSSIVLWDEFVPAGRLPQVLNPASSFIQNCNSTPFGATFGSDNPPVQDYVDYSGIERYETNRSLRARQIFGDDLSITWEEFLAYKYDTAYSPESRMARFITTITGMTDRLDESMQPAVQVLRQWDRETDVENTHAALPILAFQPFLALYETEIPVDSLLAGLKRARQHLEKTFGTLTPKWGDVNRLRRGDVDLALAGGPDVLHAVYGQPDEDGRLRAVAGDSYILLVRWLPDGSVQSESIQPFGSAPVDSASRHYSDQSVLFARKRLKPVWMNRSEIEKNLERKYRPGQNP